MNERAHAMHEMARVGSAAGYDICVYEGEGPVPHFHFWRRGAGAGGCLKILSNEYFAHGKYRASLNAAETRALMRFLLSPARNSRLTNYQYICLLWSTNNPRYALDGRVEDMSPPDYRDMR